MIQVFQLGQQKIKFYKATQIDNYNNSPSFYYNKNVVPNLNKKQNLQIQ